MAPDDLERSLCVNPDMYWSGGMGFLRPEYTNDLSHCPLSPVGLHQQQASVPSGTPLHVEITWIDLFGAGNYKLSVPLNIPPLKALPIVVHEGLLEQGIEATPSGRLNPYWLCRFPL
jgi:hypothetical protein